MGELLTLENAKQIAAYKAVDEYVKVILLLNKWWYDIITGYINLLVFYYLNFAYNHFTE